MSEDEPETKDGLSKDIKDGIGNDFGIHVNVTGTISDTPDAASR